MTLEARASWLWVEEGHAGARQVCNVPPWSGSAACTASAYALEVTLSRTTCWGQRWLKSLVNRSCEGMPSGRKSPVNALTIDIYRLKWTFVPAVDLKVASLMVKLDNDDQAWRGCWASLAWRAPSSFLPKKPCCARLARPLRSCCQRRFSTKVLQSEHLLSRWDLATKTWDADVQGFWWSREPESHICHWKCEENYHQAVFRTSSHHSIKPKGWEVRKFWSLAATFWFSKVVLLTLAQLLRALHFLYSVLFIWNNKFL